MKIAFVTTSINTPTVISLYRALCPSAHFFIAADEKTPLEAYQFCADILHCEIYSPDRQKELGYESSSLIGWNTDSRRNIALLEALRWGAELIISFDDDMVPVLSPNDPSWSFTRLFSFPHNGLQLGAPNRWFDAGAYTMPPAKQRGLPPDTYTFNKHVEAVTNVEIGAAQGIILGVPDTDAATAITNAPLIHSATDMLRNGFVVEPQAYSVFNSQLTAFRRQFAPAFAQFYRGQGRNTDIFASLLMRRVMAERNFYTYFGPPTAYHARQPRPLFNDLKAEMYGIEHIAEYADYLRRSPAGGTVTDDCRLLTEGCAIWDDDTKAVFAAFYDDVEKVL
jgi:hypothetical protein